MKFPEIWIKKFFKKKTNSKSIKDILNKNGFETKNYWHFSVKKKFFHLKIKQIFNKTYKYIVYYNNKKKEINIYNNNKYIHKILNNNNLYCTKQCIKKNVIFNILKKTSNKENLYFLYQNKQDIYYINQILQTHNIFQIKPPNNRIDCHNILGIARELCCLTNTKLHIKKISINKTKKSDNYFSLEGKNYKNYKYIIVEIKNLNKKISKNIKYKLDYLNLINNDILLNIINYIIIEYGQYIYIHHLELPFLKNKISKTYLHTKIHKILKKKLSKFQIIDKHFAYQKTTKLLLIAPLLKTKFIKKINKKSKLFSYISNTYNKIQILSLKKIIKILKKHFSIQKISSFLKEPKKKNNTINLYFDDVCHILGFKIKKSIIINILKNIGCVFHKTNPTYLKIIPPKWRKDLNIKEDLVEEIIRIYGYNNIPNISPKTNIIITKKITWDEKIYNIKRLLIDQQYKEIINFHFSNEKKEILVNKKKLFIYINNPLSNDISILRSSLIPNMLYTLKYNLQRQNNRIKIFEIGTCYLKTNINKIKKIHNICAMVCGYKNIKHWNIKNNRLFNFYDLKHDLEYLIYKNNNIKTLDTEIALLPFLEEKKNLNIKINNQNIGYLGQISKKIQKKLDIKYPIFLFEINIKKCLSYKTKKNKFLFYKYPLNKRDITLIINKNILINKIIQKCLSLNKLITDIYVINTFNNEYLNIKNKKNITLRLIIQHNKKTLTDKNINTIIINCKKKLKKIFHAEIT